MRIKFKKTKENLIKHTPPQKKKQLEYIQDKMNNIRHL